jgi:hypothetical protein
MHQYNIRDTGDLRKFGSYRQEENWTGTLEGLAPHVGAASDERLLHEEAVTAVGEEQLQQFRNSRALQVGTSGNNIYIYIYIYIYRLCYLVVRVPGC